MLEAQTRTNLSSALGRALGRARGAGSAALPPCKADEKVGSEMSGEEASEKGCSLLVIVVCSTPRAFVEVWRKPSTPGIDPIEGAIGSAHPARTHARTRGVGRGREHRQGGWELWCMAADRAALRQLLRALRRYAPDQSDLRRFVLSEARRVASAGDGAAARLREIAEEHTFLLDQIDAHKRVLLENDISVDRESRQRELVRRTARRVGLTVPAFEDETNT